MTLDDTEDGGIFRYLTVLIDLPCFGDPNILVVVPKSFRVTHQKGSKSESAVKNGMILDNQPGHGRGAVAATMTRTPSTSTRGCIG